MEFNRYVCGKEFGLQIVLAARYNFNIICAIKRLFAAAQHPNESRHYIKEAQYYIDAEKRHNQDNLEGLARWEAQQ